MAVSQVCVEVREVIRGEGGELGRRRYIRSGSERIPSETVGTGYRSLPCAGWHRQMLTSEFSSKQSSLGGYTRGNIVGTGW